MGKVNFSRYIALVLSFTVVLGNVLADHFFSPIGIEISPIIIIIAVLFICAAKPAFSNLLMTCFVFMLIAINDSGIKLYGGGIHDSEGQGFVNLLFFICFISGLIMLLVAFFKNKQLSSFNVIGPVILFFLLGYMYMHFFDQLGLDLS